MAGIKRVTIRPLAYKSSFLKGPVNDRASTSQTAFYDGETFSHIVDVVEREVGTLSLSGLCG